MKRITFTLAPVLLTDDDTDPIALEHRLGNAIRGLEATLDVTIETVVHLGGTQIETARPGTCRIGDHTFYAPHYFSADRQVPDICPNHARSENDAQVLDFHRPPFAEVTRLTGLTPLIWDSGGNTKTIVIPLTTPEPGHDWVPPYYMGLEEGDTDDGLWQGSVGFYATEEEADGGDGIDVVDAPRRHPLHPHRWAALIAEHYHALIHQNDPRS